VKLLQGGSSLIICFHYDYYIASTRRKSIES
jgi:hypothetical protein